MLHLLKHSFSVVLEFQVFAFVGVAHLLALLAAKVTVVKEAK